MPESNPLLLARVDTLARLNEDACDGYATAADLASDPALAKQLIEWSSERRRFAVVLRHENDRAGVTQAPRGTPSAGVHRAWMGLRHFAGSSDETLIQECLRGESTAVATYQYVLARTDWSARTALHAQIGSQFVAISAHVGALEKDLLARIGIRDAAAKERRAKVLIQSRHTLSLATTGEDGPWASSVFYVNDGFIFFFLSDPASRHATNLRFDARVAATINDDFAAWVDAVGIQLEGRAELVSDAERAEALQRLLGRFPFLHSIEGDASDVAAESSYALFKIVPTRVWLVDHERGLHGRFDLDLSHANSK